MCFCATFILLVRLFILLCNVVICLPWICFTCRLFVLGHGAKYHRCVLLLENAVGVILYLGVVSFCIDISTTDWCGISQCVVWSCDLLWIFRLFVDCCICFIPLFCTSCWTKWPRWFSITSFWYFWWCIFLLVRCWLFTFCYRKLLSNFIKYKLLSLFIYLKIKHVKLSTS